jgi:UDP-N-acetylglucosamine 2-epimerase (non-hydrolysing)
LRENTEWLETVEDGWNVLVGGNRDKIDKMINEFTPLSETHKERFGSGDASRAIVFRMGKI